MSRVLIFNSASSRSVAVKSDAIIGFDVIGGNYRIYLQGGAHIDVESGHYEYMQITEAMQKGE